ncbi:hypothetical protein HY418_00360 [Candidatus Kaiserbacteria bacterium]|nr:hypothetical protein [Candidatus Kaiserbacteria bacterium]
MSRTKLATLILRVGVAFAFLFPPIDALANPYTWIGYFPSFVHGITSDLVLLNVFGVVEVIIAIWILSGWRIFWPSAAAAAVLGSIVAFNAPQFEVLFRDLSIAAMASALAVVSYGDETRGYGTAGRTRA